LYLFNGLVAKDGPPMIVVPDDRCERHRLFEAIDEAFKAGDLNALKLALGNAPRWFDEDMPFELGLGHPLEYAIYWSPLGFVEALIAAGAPVNYDDGAGFPSLIAALSTDRHGRNDRLDVVKLLIRHGADLNQRGLNDWTPLHYATSLRDLEAIRVLLDAGADPTLRTRIDEGSTPLEDAEAAGFSEAAALLRSAMERIHGG
jgi:ankyrin repeat protein